jgi:hypothetical protein
VIPEHVVEVPWVASLEVMQVSVAVPPSTALRLSNPSSHVYARCGRTPSHCLIVWQDRISGCSTGGTVDVQQGSKLLLNLRRSVCV